LEASVLFLRANHGVAAGQPAGDANCVALSPPSASSPFADAPASPLGSHPFAIFEERDER
jgi:hypothetical protein